MLPFRSGRARKFGAAGFLFSLLALGFAALAASPTPKSAKVSPTPKGSNSLADIPLPIGQEAKGLVLPDIDVTGHLRARFEATKAKRTDADHLAFIGLKMTTYTPENTPELVIDMPVSTLDLNTRVIISTARTTVKRADFNISGDRMQFDTIARRGTLVGNVKMVITDQSRVMGKTGQ